MEADFNERVYDKMRVPSDENEEIKKDDLAKSDETQD